MAAYLLTANNDGDAEKGENWDDGMYETKTTVAGTPGPRDGQEAASGMKETQPKPEEENAAWADWMRPRPDSPDDPSKPSKAHQGGALNAAKALQEKDAANRAKEASTKMLMDAAKSCASTRMSLKQGEEKKKKADRTAKRAASSVQTQNGSPSQDSPPSALPIVRQLFSSPQPDAAPQWLSPSAAGSSGVKKRPALQGKKKQKVEEEELPPKKKDEESTEEEEVAPQEGEDCEEEDEESTEEEEEEEEDEEMEEEELLGKKKQMMVKVKEEKVAKKPAKAQKPLRGDKNTFAGNRPPAGKDGLELFNFKKQAFLDCQAGIDEKNPSEVKKVNHRVNDQFAYWKHMQEAVAQLKLDNAQATQADYRKCFGEAAKSWRAKCVLSLKELFGMEIW